LDRILPRPRWFHRQNWVELTRPGLLFSGW